VIEMEASFGEREGKFYINGKAAKDTIWYSFVQGFEDEWRGFSEAELNSVMPSIWEISPKNIPFSGRRR